MPDLPACAGQWEIFDSTDAEDHEQAVALCAACPVRASLCLDQLAEAKRLAGAGYGPVGTWAGSLLGVTKEQARRRIEREDTAFGVEEAREAHAAYRRGVRGAWAEVGYRVHDRRRRRGLRVAA